MQERRSNFEYEDLLACGRGELFGEGPQLPLPPMLMFDRISEIAEVGGEYGKGLVRAVLELKPDLWFFPCHFKGDPVMPGCLGLDALWQLLGFFLGWLGSPGKGRALGMGEIKFSGQVLPTMKNIVYGIDIKRVMRSKLVLGIADGWLSADGSVIYRALDLKVGLFNNTATEADEAVIGRPQCSDGIEARRHDEARGRHRDGHRLVHRQQHAGSAGVAARSKVGHRRADKYAELGFRCQVHGAPTLDPSEAVDRRAMRFLGGGAAWNHVAMEQAIRDAGLTETEISNERTGIIMGSGGPSTRTIVEAADIARTKGPKRVGPFAVPKAMSSTASATLATWFKIKGVNYSISSACATSNHCIGNASEIIQIGKQDMIFAGGCEELDWTLSVLFDAMGAMSSNFNETPTRPRAPMTSTATASSSPAAPACWCSKSSSTPRRAAPKSTPKSPAMAQPPMATTW